MIWYVRCDEREMGPLGEDALRALVGTGRITADTQLWREGLSGWTAASVLPGVLGPRAAAPLAADPRVAPGSRPSAAPESSRSVAPVSRDDTLRELAPPWRRYWARSLDILVGIGVAAFLLGGIWPGLFARLNALTGQKWVVLVVLLPFALAADALLYWVLGNSPAKAIAGIKVLGEGGHRALSAPAYLGRNLGLYVFGLGLGIPLLSLVTLICNYRLAAGAKAAIWERLSGSRVHVLAGAEPRTWVTAGIYLLAVTALVVLGQHQEQKEARYTATHAVAPILRQELTQAANSVNANAPHMIDSITRLDGARVGPGPLFTYEYTLTSMRLSLLSPAAVETLRWRLSAHVRQAVCRGTALQPMLLTGTTVRFQYHDRDGLDLVLVSISRADCGK